LISFGRSETERNQSPAFDEVESQHPGRMTGCLCGLASESNWAGLNWSDYGARWYMPELGRWNAVDPMASARNWVSPYNYVQNNPLSRIDPTGLVDDWYRNDKTNEVEYHEGSGAKDGYTHLGKEGYAGHGDNTGLAFYGNADGTKSYYEPTELKEVTSVLNSPSRDGDQARQNSYGPWMGPDAVSIQVNASASGLFSEAGFSGGIAMSGNEIGVFGGASAGTGLSAPGIGLSVQINFHERTDLTHPSSLEYIGGTDAGGSVGLGLIGGYSRSVLIQNGKISKAPGFHTYSAGIGVGGGISLGARTSVSKTGVLSTKLP